MTQPSHSVIADLRDMVASVAIGSIFVLSRLVPGRPGNGIKIKLQRWLFARLSYKIGNGTQISPGFFVFRRGNFSCGRNCRLGYGFSVWNHACFSVGDNLLASHGFKAICGTHATDPARTNISGPISIGDNVWLGANVLIVGPCKIGDNVIIGANSFVTGEIASDSVVAGSPGRILYRSTGTTSTEMA